MNISAAHPSPSPAAHARPRAGGTPVSAAEPAPVPVVPAAPEPASPERGSGHEDRGLVRAAGHGSDVAALRRWINHPDLRADLDVPDLTATPKGNGFQKAVAAYEAAIAVVPPADDPAPVVVADPAPVVVTDEPAAA